MCCLGGLQVNVEVHLRTGKLLVSCSPPSLTSSAAVRNLEATLQQAVRSDRNFGISMK